MIFFVFSGCVGFLLLSLGFVPFVGFPGDFFREFFRGFYEKFSGNIPEPGLRCGPCVLS
jgi:hypothetical protein